MSKFLGNPGGGFILSLFMNTFASSSDKGINLIFVFPFAALLKISTISLGVRLLPARRIRDGTRSGVVKYNLMSSAMDWLMSILDVIVKGALPSPGTYHAWRSGKKPWN